MKLLAIYILTCAIGVFVGGRLKKSKKEISCTGKVQTALLILLLATMGGRLGANREVISSLGEIGLSAFIITIFTVIGSLAMVFLIRKLFGFNSKGESVDD